jgi:hypothetical protein
MIPKHLLTLFTTIILASSQIHANDLGFLNFDTSPSLTPFTKSSFNSYGFTIPWVDGFDQGRTTTDTLSYSKPNALKVSYPAQGVGTKETGAQATLLFTPTEEVWAQYRLYFSNNFDWGGTSQGGKLPGLASGDNCSGGSSCNGTNGFSARLMWRTGGKVVLYLYHMDKPKTYGEDHQLYYPNNDEVVFAPGQWYTVTERVKINTGNNHDGEVDVWVNDELTLSKTGIQFVSNGDLIDNFYFSTFHGGSGSQWAPSVDCFIWFDDILIASTPITFGDTAESSSQSLTTSSSSLAPLSSSLPSTTSSSSIGTLLSSHTISSSSQTQSSEAGSYDTPFSSNFSDIHSHESLLSSYTHPFSSSVASANSTDTSTSLLESHFTTNMFTSNHQITIYTIQGSKVTSFASDQYPIEIQALPKGVYILEYNSIPRIQRTVISIQH